MWIAERAALVSNLDALITARLFGPGKWLGDRESITAIENRLVELALEECGSDGTWRNTALGNELNLNLLMVFSGIWDPYDAVMILEDFALIDRLEAWELYDALAARRDPERLLRKRVQAAYLRYFGLRLAN